jgi:anti-sigma factor RsiW
MANERQKRLMQEALDQSLSPESQRELQSHLKRNPGDAMHFDRLKEVDTMLRNAPFERAPKRLALDIMARLAETLSQTQLSRISGLALALGLSLAAAVVMPLLLLAAWLILNAIGNAGSLAAIIQNLVGLLSLVVATLEMFIRQAQAVLAANPALPVIIAPIIPAALWWLRRSGADRDEHGRV